MMLEELISKTIPLFLDSNPDWVEMSRCILGLLRPAAVLMLRVPGGFWKKDMVFYEIGE